MARMIVISGPGDPGLADRIASELSAELVRAEHKVFPDGEAYVRVATDLEGAVAVIVQSMYPDQDRRIMELMLLADACRGAGASRVVAVVPYMAYARQDRRFLSGEPISISTILRALWASGVDGLVTLDLHKAESLQYFPGPSVNVDPSPAFAEALKGLSDAVVIGPDKGALVRARSLAEKLGVEYDYLEKFRDRVTGEVTYRPKSLSVKGKTVILVDDIISTGGTIAKSAAMLREQGASRIIVACSHGLFVGNALERVKKSGVERILAANTVPLPKEVEVVDVSNLLAEAVKKIVERL